MKTKFYWVALLASAALIAQAKAGGHPGGGGGGFAPAHSAPAFHSAPRGNFGGGRFMGPGRYMGPGHFSPMGVRSPNSFHQQRFDASNRAFTRSHQIANRTNNRQFVNHGSNTARNHVFARHTADWHRDWDRNHDHWWHGHRCHFANGFWFIYDTGFYPYDYWYPYDYYANGYYDPYYYDPGVYGADNGNYYGQGAQESSAQYADATVAGAQEQLARQGYYRGEIDGIFGAETRRAIMRYQGDHGLRVTGNLTPDTLQALGLRRVASN